MRTNRNSWHFETKWPKWPWRPKSMTSRFNTSWEYPIMHLWCKSGDFSSNLWWVIARTTEFPSILSQNGEQGRWPQFSIQAESIPGCMFGANLVVLAQIYDELLCGQADYKNFESKWPKWPWRSKSMNPIFNTNQEYPMRHIWCKIGDCSSNLWRVIVRTK